MAEAVELERLLGYDRFFDQKLEFFPLKTSYLQVQEQESNKLFEENFIFEGAQNISQYTDEQKIKKFDQKEMGKIIEEKKKEWWKMAEKKDLSQQEKNDLVMLKLRNFVDHKNFQKSNDFKNLPKYFQMGTVIDNGDNYNGQKIARGKRSNNLLEQILKEDKEIGFSKRKFGEIQKQKQEKAAANSWKEKKKQRKITKKIQKQSQKKSKN